MGTPRKDYNGMRFGHWTILSEDKPRPATATLFADGRHVTLKRRVVIAKCDCGTVRSVLLQSLLGLKSRSCGCKKKDMQTESRNKNRKRNTVHHTEYLEALKQLYMERT